MAEKHSTYKIGHEPGHVKHHEWRTAENSAQYVLPRLQLLAQLNPHLKMLDVGAGPGTISTSFSKYIPEGEIIATDISEDIVSRAAAYAEAKGVTNISFQYANVYELPFPDGSFDVVHAHQVLCHLDSPVDAIKEMIRVTKKGGFLALRESDMQMWCIWPNMKPLLHFQQISIEVLKENGGQDMGGRMLVNWILQADVEREDIEASCGTWCFAQKEDKDTWSEAFAERAKTGQLRSKAIELELATEEEMDAMIDAWYRWAETEDSMLAIMNGQAIVDIK